MRDPGVTEAPLCQCLCPGSDLVLWFAKWYHWGRLGEGYMGSLYYFSQLAACDSTIISK